MSTKAISYSIKEGLKSIARNRMFSLASVGTMVACLFMLSVFLCLLLNFNSIVNSAESTVTISVYFSSDIDENRFEIPDVSKLTIKEQKKLDLFL